MRLGEGVALEVHQVGVPPLHRGGGGGGAEGGG
jgi:hypothetical protein